MPVLAIQSQVAYGHVGNSAAVLPLQRLGFEVWPVPTAVLSNHPGHGAMAGRMTPPAEVRALLDGIADLGVLGQCEAVLTGYLGEPGNGEIALGAVDRVRAANGDARWLCDPVIGDSHTGVYVRDGIPEFFRDRAAAAADIMTPNQFELGWLSGIEVSDLESAVAACGAIAGRGGATVVCTSLTAGLPADRIGVLALLDGSVWLATTPRLAQVPHGGGDMFAALLLGHILKDAPIEAALEAAVAATYAMLAASAAAASDELLLVARQDAFVAPAKMVEITRIN